ncbi:hypothetical protein E1B28_002110 [Marasmius oreades]|uniref:Uncharacterized protein n=1 Tax=Marasmius oreades TaxID=181124 RepID=A0A9P7UL64_9AGAR|nr:uncharacterized protein E1B28_002110 [Marasmius oreades]KAG7086150.1 hypothetical protein E1B28_002110 [Marasmius oreades]
MSQCSSTISNTLMYSSFFNIPDYNHSLPANATSDMSSSRYRLRGWTVCSGSSLAFAEVWFGRDFRAFGVIPCMPMVAHRYRQIEFGGDAYDGPGEPSPLPMPGFIGKENVRTPLCTEEKEKV